MVETAQCRSRENSKNEAMSRLIGRLSRASTSHAHKETSVARKTQMGSGQRGDKVRTYRFQDDVATNHVNGKKARVSKVMDGYFELLW
jgi:peptide chain release factor 1